MASLDEFLTDREPDRWEAADGMPASIKGGNLFLQEADYGLDVAIADASKRSRSAEMRHRPEQLQAVHLYDVHLVCWLALVPQSQGANE
jgi:hypothetical protein